MTLFALSAICSFVIMGVMIAPKIALVRARESVHNEHVGLSHVLYPVYNRMSERLQQIWGSVWILLSPYLTRIFITVGASLHRIAILVARKLLDFAAVMRGRGFARGRNERVPM